MRGENDCEWMWMFLNDFEWLGIITWWIIRWTSTFWWIEIKNLFSTDGSPMMIMTKFIQNYSPILDTCNVFRGMISKRLKKISRNSRIFRNMKFRDYSNQDFSTAVRNLLPRVVNINYTGLDLTSTRWFLVERTGWKNTG